MREGNHGVADTQLPGFQRRSAWRREFSRRLSSLTDWMRQQQLLDAGLQLRMERLQGQLLADKVMLAFVAEFSRGKSELINALLFAAYGRRIMPAGAGRTTMCPTELGYQPELPSCLRLLPIETRLQPQSLAEWRERPEAWTQMPLDAADAQLLAATLAQVADVQRVSQDVARGLGFWNDELPDDNPPADAQGLVQVPRWRHALVNLAHPLLREGLVILDTPGLNAIGVEPELTVHLIPQAQAAVFILAADAGVTRSDLAVWREHLVPEADNQGARLVVLNKIDTLWDALSTPEQVDAQIERQRMAAAELLGIPPAQVVAVSAQKGLVARIGGDDALLQASRLPQLERLLLNGIARRRERILRAAVAKGVSELRAEAARMLNARRRDLAEQKIELQGLSGKNTAVIRSMRQRIERERHEFDAGDARIQALRAVQRKLLGEALDLLGSRAFAAQTAPLQDALRRPGLKLGAGKAYAQVVERLDAGLRRAQAGTQEMQSMLEATYRQLNTEYGFALQVLPAPDFTRYRKDLARMQRGHAPYFGVSQALRLAQPAFATKLGLALASRLRAVFESAFAEVETWSQAAAEQLEDQVRERRKSFTRRIEAIDRIQQASGGLQQRLAEIESSVSLMDLLDGRLQDLTSYFVTGEDSDYLPTQTLPVA